MPISLTPQSHQGQTRNTASKHETNCSAESACREICMWTTQSSTPAVPLVISARRALRPYKRRSCKPSVDLDLYRYGSFIGLDAFAPETLPAARVGVVVDSPMTFAEPWTSDKVSIRAFFRTDASGSSIACTFYKSYPRRIKSLVTSAFDSDVRFQRPM